MDMNTAVSLLNIKEDLLSDEAPKGETHSKTKACAPAKKIAKARVAKAKIVKAEIKTFDRLLTLATKKLGCTVSELKTWLNQIADTPETVQQNALRLITKHNLDPFMDEISIHQYEDGHWQVFISINGWSKLINEHPAFNGISFTESTELVGGIPSWMGCAIYRNDRVVPIEVKEYLCEIKTEHSIWKDMPRRMLRYRVIAQCARLAFGASTPDEKKIEANYVLAKNKIAQARKEVISIKNRNMVMLKSKLQQS